MRANQDRVLIDVKKGAPTKLFEAMRAAPLLGEIEFDVAAKTGSKKVTTLEQARRIIRVYLRRWDIEVFFKILNTGCRVERVQLKTSEALIRVLMIWRGLSRVRDFACVWRAIHEE